MERDVALQHDLVAIDRERCAQVLLGALSEPAAHLRIHARDALRRFKQALAVGVFPDSLKKEPRGGFDFLLIDHGTPHARVEMTFGRTCR